MDLRFSALFVSFLIVATIVVCHGYDAGWKYVYSYEVSVVNATNGPLLIPGHPVSMQNISLEVDEKQDFVVMHIKVSLWATLLFFDPAEPRDFCRSNAIRKMKMIAGSLLC
jgi:hypothetical protein